MSICTDVGSFIESKTTVVQTSNVGFTSEVSDYLVMHTGPGFKLQNPSLAGLNRKGLNVVLKIQMFKEISYSKPRMKDKLSLPSDCVEARHFHLCVSFISGIHSVRTAHEKIESER